nr:trypsin-like peptidase domain-containing protein [uncultured Albidiferax sp.]
MAMVGTARKWVARGAVCGVASVLVACGGGSGSDSAASSTSTTNCTTSDTVSAEASSAVSQTALAAPLDSLATRAESMRFTGVSHVSPIQTRSGQQLRTSSISLGELSQARLATAAAQSGGGPRKVGLARTLLQTASVAGTAAVLDWQSSDSGGKVAAISISSDAAKGLRLGVLVRSLPTQATLRIYAQGSSTAYEVAAQEVLATLQRNRAAGDTTDAARMYWTPLVEGSEATLEVELPASVSTDGVQIAIPSLSHVYSALASDGENVAKVGEAGSCEVNVACNTDYSSAESNAVARMVFVGSDGGTYQCSGTLVNDSSSSGTPYFLSANHCISKQSEASTLQTYWFYRATSCSGTTLNSAYQTRTGGATLLYASAVTDTSFMQLVDTPPTGVTYAGWSVAAPTLNAAVAGIHHPKGDLQKLSTGSLSAFQDCSVLNATSDTFTCSSGTQSGSKFINATFSSGVTESGSSGSPLFQTSGSSHYMVGQLYGGSSSCAAPSGSNIYGRFDVAYNAALSQWLNVASSAALAVSSLGNGSGTVSSSPSGISCGSSCAAPFSIGSSVVLTATPASGSSFTGWGGACSGTGSCSLTMDAAKSVTATFSVPSIALATALDSSLVWSTGGDAGFFGQTSTYKVGGSAAQSGAIGNSQRSTLSTSLTGPGNLAFDWKVSSEPGYDLFSVAVDGVQQYSWSGQGAWSSNTLAIASGSHSVVWTYAKDANRSSGQDAGWVDNVVYTAGTASTTTTTPATTCTSSAAAIAKRR